MSKIPNFVPGSNPEIAVVHLAPPRRPQVPIPTPRDKTMQVIGEIAAMYGLERADIFRRTNSKFIAIPRQHCMAYLRDHGWVYERIGVFFGLNHATIISGVRKHRARAG